MSALDANTGRVIWKSYTIPEEPKPTKKNSLGTQLWAPAGASIWSTPTIDTKLKAIYVSTGNAFTEPAAKTSDAIVAFDMATGKMLWWYQGVENDASPQGCGGRGPKGEQCPEHPGPDWDFANSPILKTLANGLRVVVLEDHAAPVVQVHTWYRFGALDETPGKTGLAHALEHMMFRGTHALSSAYSAPSSAA